MSPRRHRGDPFDFELLEDSIATGEGTPESAPGLLDFDPDEDLYQPDEPPMITHDDLVREMPRGTRVRTWGER